MTSPFPAADVIGDNTDRPAWLARRRTGLGASDAAAIVGKDPSRGPFALYAQLTGEYDPDIGERPEVRLGRVVEGAVGELYREQTGRPVEPCRVHLRSQVVPIMLATLDAVTVIDGAPAPLEIKTTGSWRAEEWADGAPPRPWWQTQAQMLVTGARKASIAALIWPRVVWLDVERDDAAIAYLVRCAEDLWARVQRRDPPPPDPSPATRAALASMWPADDGSTVVLPGSLLETSACLDAWRSERKRLDALIDAGESEVKAALGAATRGVLGDGSAWTWKRQTRRGFTAPETTSRVLRRHAAKGM